MTANCATPRKGQESTGRKQSDAENLRTAVSELEREAGLLADAVESGTPVDPDRVAEVRKALNAVQQYVEDDIAATVDGTEPYAFPALAHLTYGVHADALGVSLTEVNRIRKQREE